MVVATDVGIQFGASDREMMAGELKGASKSNKQAYQRSVDMLAVVWRTKLNSRGGCAGGLMFGLGVVAMAA